MKAIFVNLLMTALLLTATPGKAQMDHDAVGSEETGLGSGTMTMDVHKEETPLDMDPAPTDAPIDGGLSILLLAGAAYGAKKIVSRRPKLAGSRF